MDKKSGAAMPITEEYVALSKERSITEKQRLRTAFLKALQENNKDFFSNCVVHIGKEWHVSRTVSSEERDGFIESLWNHRAEIQSGAYEWNKSEYEAYSYESKICYVINPVHYKLIYDSRNRAALKTAYPDRKNAAFGKDNWQALVDDYYRQKLQFSPKDTKADITRIFAEDFNLWFNAEHFDLLFTGAEE